MGVDARKSRARLDLAQACLDQDNLPAADILCRHVLDGEPGNGRAWYLLGRIAEKLAQPAKAAAYFHRAQNMPGEAPFAPEPAAPAGSRYLLIKAWGHGFWSEVTHVLGGMLLAEITGRIPVVELGKGCRFGDGSGRDAFGLFFEPVSATTGAALAAMPQAACFPTKWSSATLLGEDPGKMAGRALGAIDFLGRTETIAVADFYLSVPELWPWIPDAHPLGGLSLLDVYRRLIGRYLHPLTPSLAAAAAFRAARLAGRPYLALHLRGLDKALEDPNIPGYIERALSLVDTLRPELPVFLMTDDSAIAQRAAARLGRRVVTSDATRGGGDVGLHFRAGADGPRLGREILLDVLVALGAEEFVGIGHSNVSSMVALMKDWAGAGHLFGFPVLLRRGGTLYVSPQHYDLILYDD